MTTFVVKGGKHLPTSILTNQANIQHVPAASEGSAGGEGKKAEHFVKNTMFTLRRWGERRLLYNYRYGRRKGASISVRRHGEMKGKGTHGPNTSQRPRER